MAVEPGIVVTSTQAYGIYDFTVANCTLINDGRIYANSSIGAAFTGGGNASVVNGAVRPARAKRSWLSSLCATA